MVKVLEWLVCGGVHGVATTSAADIAAVAATANGDNAFSGGYNGSSHGLGSISHQCSCYMYPLSYLINCFI